MAYWNINKTLSHNALFNFIVGNRGGGKTYGAKDWSIRDYLKRHHQFAYVRRYKEEFSHVGTFFDDIRGAYPKHELMVDGMQFYINKELAGHSMPLSTAKILKSSTFPDIETIIFDEFIIEKGVYHYLPNEVMAFLELYETIARKRDVRVFFLSNAITMTNPYFIYFDISLPYGKSIAKKGDILIELVQDEEFIAEKKKTRFGQIIDGTSYSAYSIENKFLLDNSNFVQRKSPSSRYYFTFYYMDVGYGVYIDYNQGMLFVSLDVDPTCGIKYSLTMADHKPNTLLLGRGKKNALLSVLVEQYKQGNVRFESIKIKNIVQEVIKMTL